MRYRTEEREKSDMDKTTEQGKERERERVIDG